jgi:two-component system, NtrC family, response regulator AtoC
VDFFIDRHIRRFKKSVRRIFEKTSLHSCSNWPGKVREPKNTIERGMILEDEPLPRRCICRSLSASPADARSYVAQRPQAASSSHSGCRYVAEELEPAMVELAMRQANGNQIHAAKLPEIGSAAQRYKLKKFGLIRGDDEGSPKGGAEDQQKVGKRVRR